MINLRTLLVITIGIFSSGDLLSQGGVGIGIDVPDNSAVLHLHSPTSSQGLLVPRLTTTQRTGQIAGPANGLLVYDVTLNQFCFYNGADWFVLNEFVRVAGTNAITHTGNVSVTGSVTAGDVTASNLTANTGIATNTLTATGTITAPNYALNTTGNGPVPQGGIIMWRGAQIPAGWALCDGSNGTPDLRDRFIVGAGNSYSIGEVGGLNTVTLSVSQLPAHNHEILGQTGGDNNDNNNTQRFAGGDKGVLEDGFFFSTYSQNTGSNQPIENRPPYYSLAYIIKL